MNNQQAIKVLGGKAPGNSDTTDASATQALTDTPNELGGQLPSFVDLLPEQALPYWQLVQKYPIFEGLIVLLFFWLLAYLIRRYAISLIEKLAGKTETDLDDRIIDEVRGPIFITVCWIGVIIAAASAGLTEGWARFIPPVIMSLIVFIWIRTSLALSSAIFTSLARDPHHFKKIDIRTEPLLIICSKIIVLVLGSYLILVIWGINPVGLLASAGIVGIAVGFAAKDTLANLFSGVFILADRPYRLGDYINLDTGERGKVTHIGIRSTRILTRDDIEITVPNGIIGNAKVVNESGGPHQKMRVRIAVQCAYEANIDDANRVLMQVASDNDDVCEHPTPRVRVRGFGQSGIDIELLCWISEPELRGKVSHRLYSEIHRAFAKHELEIPYPRLVAIVQKDDENQLNPSVIDPPTEER